MKKLLLLVVLILVGGCSTTTYWCGKQIKTFNQDEAACSFSARAAAGPIPSGPPAYYDSKGNYYTPEPDFSHVFWQRHLNSLYESCLYSKGYYKVDSSTKKCP